MGEEANKGSMGEQGFPILNLFDDQIGWDLIYFYGFEKLQPRRCELLPTLECNVTYPNAGLRTKPVPVSLR